MNSELVFNENPIIPSYPLDTCLPPLLCRVTSPQLSPQRWRPDNVIERNMRYFMTLYQGAGQS